MQPTHHRQSRKEFGGAETANKRGSVKATDQQHPSRVALRQLNWGPLFGTRVGPNAVELYCVQQPIYYVESYCAAVSWGRQQLGRWETDPVWSWTVLDSILMLFMIYAEMTGVPVFLTV